MRKILMVLVVAASSCKPQQASKATPAPTPGPAPVVVVEQEPDVGGPDVPQTLWSERPPIGRGLPYRMTRRGPDVEVFRGDVRFQLTDLEFGECTEVLPAPEAPEHMKLGGAEESPVWLQLRSESEAASLRLSTRDALLVINDGCQRVANITTQLIGAAADSPDPIFAPDAVAPEASTEVTGFELRRKDETQIWRDGEHVLTIVGLLEDATVSARAAGETVWLRVSSGIENTSKDGESATGREITQVFALGETQPALLLQNDFRFGAEGADREESRTASARLLGPWEASGKRTSVVDAMNIGAGRCPEMEGVLAFRFEHEEVEWRVSTDGKPQRLGTAERKAMFASGCLDEAKQEVRRRSKLLADKVPPGPLSWSSSVTQ